MQAFNMQRLSCPLTPWPPSEAAIQRPLVRRLRPVPLDGRVKPGHGVCDGASAAFIEGTADV